MARRRNWFDYNEPRFGQPTRMTRRITERGPISALGATGMQTGIRGGMPSYSRFKTKVGREPYITPQEIVDEVQERFNRAPLSYQTDPATGQVRATRSMAKPERPREMPFGMGQDMFGKGDLESTWILPRGSLSGDRFTQRTTPQSEEERREGARVGASYGGQTTARLNPARYWPESGFDVPETATGEPVFGTTVNYARSPQTWHAPPGRGQAYGQFAGRAEPTIPRRWPMQMMGTQPFQTPEEYRLERRKRRHWTDQEYEQWLEEERRRKLGVL